MLTRVDVQSENPLQLHLEDARPDDSIIVDKIEGLDPPDIDLFLGDYARDGGFYNGRRVGKRNVVFYLTLNPNYTKNETVSDLREQLYRAFIEPRAAGDDVRIDLLDSVKPPRYISGYTEKLETTIFSKEKELMVSLVCPNPYIYNVDETVTNANGPSVGFPYEGTAETGVEVKLQLTSASPTLNLVVNNGSPMILNYPFEIGDIVYINTRRGERKIQLTHGGAISATGVITGGNTSNILYSQTATSRWLELHRAIVVPVTNPTGQNTMKAYGVNLTDSVASVKQIKSRGSWWGI